MFKCHMLLGVAAIFELALTQNSYWIRVRHKKIYKLFFIRDESTHEPSQFQLKLNSFSYRARLARAKLTKVILVQAKLARVWTEPRPNFFVSSHLKLERSGLLYKSTLLTTIIILNSSSRSCSINRATAVEVETQWSYHYGRKRYIQL
jgi:hypothetical protein